MKDPASQALLISAMLRDSVIMPALGEGPRKLLVLGVGESFFRRQASIAKVDTASNEQDRQLHF